MDWVKQSSSFSAQKQIGDTEGTERFLANEQGLQAFLNKMLSMLDGEKRKDSISELQNAGLIDKNGNVQSDKWLEAQSMLSSGTISGMHGLSIAGMTVSGSLSMSTDKARVSINGLDSGEFGTKVTANDLKADNLNQARLYEAAKLGTNPTDVLATATAKGGDALGIGENHAAATGLLLGAGGSAVLAEAYGRINNKGQFYDPKTGRYISDSSKEYAEMSDGDRKRLRDKGGLATQVLRNLSHVGTKSREQGLPGDEAIEEAESAKSNKPNTQQQNKVQHPTPPSTGGNSNIKNGGSPILDQHGANYPSAEERAKTGNGTSKPSGGKPIGGGSFGKKAIIAGAATALVSTAANAGGFSGETASAMSSAVSGAVEGAMMGAMVGSIIPGLGTGIGAAVGGVMGAIMSTVSAQTSTATNNVLAAPLQNAQNFNAANNYANNGVGTFTTGTGSQVTLGTGANGNATLMQNGMIADMGVPSAALRGAFAASPDTGVAFAQMVRGYEGSDPTAFASTVSLSCRRQLLPPTTKRLVRLEPISNA
ncbi:hypothetical protein AGMMS50229_11190 [Campylobacterota bacterium]|nr:hypothetical protein AGMMS50229_11190 [Campylobacterota bacterium]